MKRADVHKAISTVLGLGYFPLAPGTAGSLAGLVLCLALHGNPVLYSIVFVLIFAAGVVSSGKAEELFGYKDPSMVVIDEFACIFTVYMLVPLSASAVVIGFLVYRIMDISKVPPMKSLEKFGGGWGIMLDDLMAGIYSNLVLQVLIALNIL